MKAPDNARPPTAAMTDRGRSAEIDYHKGLNRSITIAATPVFVFFAFYWWRGGDYFQTLVFSLMSINAVVALLLGVRITDLKMQVRLKLISAGIAFGLLAVSLLAGLLSRNHFHIFFPWIFCYPIAAMLFFGQRIGLLCALLFCWTMVIALLTVPAPPLDSEGLWAFRLNAVLALLIMLAIALIAERYRVWVQRKLVAAQNEYRQAEQRQREANRELQAEIERRARSETALMQSEARYRALFEESTVSLWEEDWSAEKVAIDSTIRVTTELAPDLHATTWDTTQITMVLESVMANAVEAMAQGGLLRIVTANQRVEADPSLQPGDYAVVRIEDSGAGMDAATLARIFEPFYTTKLYGRGLGMAAAYGIVRNHDGTITVSSVANQGTQVTVCLPADHCLESRPSSIQ